MILSSKTDIGIRRETNQDAFRCGVFPDGTTWAVVCDGMGGVSGGQIASELCIEKTSDALEKGYREDMTLKSLKNLLETSISRANTAVFEKSLSDVELKGMGTTIVVVVIKGGIAVIAHVGDSRAYLVNDKVTHLTKDHSLVEFMIDTGRLTEDEAKVYPDRNVITRAVGVQNFVDSEINIYDVTENDKILICTDGLSGVLGDEDILEIMSDVNGQTSSRLIDKALENGSRDNITAVVIDSKRGG